MKPVRERARFRIRRGRVKAAGAGGLFSWRYGWEGDGGRLKTPAGGDYSGNALAGRNMADDAGCGGMVAVLAEFLNG